MEDGLKQFNFIVANRDKIVKEREAAGIKPLLRSGKTKKIIGLSCGKKNGTSEMHLRSAAQGAAELGMEMEIIRASELTVKPCKACYACNSVMTPDPKLPKCPIKDDVPWLMEKTVVEDAALIVAAPVYHLFSNALLLTLCQRMHPTMFTHMEMLNHEQKKVVGIISVGGGQDGWMSLGSVIPIEWVQHFGVIADRVEVETRYTDVDWLSRSRQLGRNVARAMSVPISEVKYMGEKGAFACPVCQSDVLQMPDQKPRPPVPGEYRYKPSHVVCPICWVHGDFYFEGETLKVKWDQWDIDHPRDSEYGVFEHMDVMFRNLNPGHKETIDFRNYAEQNAKLQAYGSVIKPGDK